MNSSIELSLQVQGSPEKRKAGRVQRACHNCRRRKQGCDEERPCKRCVEKGIECVEVEIKRKKTRSKTKEYVVQTAEYAQGFTVTRDSSSDDDEEIASSNSSEQQETLRSSENTSGTSSSDMEDSLEEMDAVPQIQREKDIGMNLLHLFPFLISVASATNPQVGQLLLNEDIMDVHSFTLFEDFPFYIPNGISSMDEPDYSESEERMKEEMIGCWRNIVQRLQIDENFRYEFRSIKELWKEIMRCLRSLEWHKVQSNLESMDCNYLYNSPPLLFWSSGGRIHHANRSFCNMTGYNVEELRVQAHGDRNIGIYGIQSLFHPEETVSLFKRQLEATQCLHRSCYYMRTRLLTKFRHEIPVSAFITNLRDSTGGLLLSVAHFSPL